MANKEIVTIKSQVELELANKETVATLVTTTFKGLQPDVMKRAMIEGMMRGFTFNDFLEKNIYAIPYAGGYSLVTSIDHARKIGMRSGVVGKSTPIYVQEGDKVVSCEITIKRKIGDYIGDFTALVFLSEYSTGKNLWASKPRTMLAKVAEMHALRMACPEELAQSYVEEEMVREATSKAILDMDSYAEKIKAVKNSEELKTVWSLLPIEAKQELADVKDEMKKKLTIPVEIKAEAINTPITAEEVAEIEAEDALKNKA